MQKIRKTNKKLIQYGASAIAFLVGNQVGATVVYTDLDPDLVLGGEGAESTLDINEDGVNDFTFIVYNYAGTLSYYGISISFSVRVAGAEALANNAFLGSIVSNSGYTNVYAPILAPGEGINADDSFAEGSASLGLVIDASVYGIPYYNLETGNWLNSDMGFLGFRLNIDKDYFYGWMRISVNADATQLIIHDYAYESEANKSIFTGATATSIDSNPLIESQIYADGNTLFINLPDAISNSINLKVFDLEGKLVLQQNNLSPLTQINCSSFATGNYIVHLSDGSLDYKKQIHINN